MILTILEWAAVIGLLVLAASSARVVMRRRAGIDDVLSYLH